MAMDTGLYSFSIDEQRIELVNEPLAGTTGIRFNDGKVDPYGNFVTGAMNIHHLDSHNCPMFRLYPDLSVEKILDGFQCFNGPCFSS